MSTTILIKSAIAGDQLTVSAKGWVVIPAAIRKKYGLQPGSKLALVDYGGVLALIPLLSEPIEQARGLLAGPASLTQALLKERQEERLREQ